MQKAEWWTVIQTWAIFLISAFDSTHFGKVLAASAFWAARIYNWAREPWEPDRSLLLSIEMKRSEISNISGLCW